MSHETGTEPPVLYEQDGPIVTVEEKGQVRPLDPRLDLRNHSPTGFEWGYSGSGGGMLPSVAAVNSRLKVASRFRVIGSQRSRVAGSGDPSVETSFS